MDPIECAKNGDIQYFRREDKGILMNARDEDGCSVLDTVVIWHHQDCCEEICKRCPELLYHTNKGSNIALHHASSRGKIKIIACLVNAAQEYQVSLQGGEVAVPEKLTRILAKNGFYALLYAVHNNHFEATKFLIEADDPEFQHTASYDGDTPLLAAMERAKAGNPTAAKIRKLILEMKPHFSKIRNRDTSWTPLHLSASKGDLDAINEIVRFCPDSTELVDDDSQNFLHIAAKFGRTEVVKHVLETKDIALHILNAQDKNGNTPLHVAALSGDVSLTTYFLYDNRVDKRTVNNQGQNVLDAVTFNYDKVRAQVFGVRDRVNEKELKDQSDFDLVVGALIAAVSFTAGITVPGGYISDGPNQGMAILSKATAFETFVVSNTVGLLLSLYAVFSHFCTRRLLNKKDIDLQVTVAMYCTLGAILSMMVAFISGSYAVLNISHRLAMTVILLCCIFFIFTFWAIWRMIRQYKQPFSSYLRKNWQSLVVTFSPKKKQPSPTIQMV